MSADILKPASSRIRAIIFDLDGTLIDTEPSAVKAVERCFAQWGIQADADDARYSTGRTWESAFEYLFVKYAIPVPHDVAAKTILDTYRAELARNLVVVPGGAACVRSLATTYGIGLVSGSHRSEILFALGSLGIQEHFQVILGAHDYPRSKPAPDGYLKAMQELSCSPEETLIFEDSEPGIASARAAGARVVAITATNHFGQDTSGADEYVKDLTGIDAKWVEDFSQRLQTR